MQQILRPHQILSCATEGALSTRYNQTSTDLFTLKQVSSTGGLRTFTFGSPKSVIQQYYSNLCAWIWVAKYCTVLFCGSPTTNVENHCFKRTTMSETKSMTVLGFRIRVKMLSLDPIEEVWIGTSASCCSNAFKIEPGKTNPLKGRVATHIFLMRSLHGIVFSKSITLVSANQHNYVAKCEAML